MSNYNKYIAIWKNNYKRRQIKFNDEKQNVEQKQYELTKYIQESTKLDCKEIIKMKTSIEDAKNIVLMAKVNMLIAKFNIDHYMILSGNTEQIDPKLYGITANQLYEITADQHEVMMTKNISKLFNL